MFIICVYFFCISLYINFDKYCQQVRTNLIILGASRKSTIEVISSKICLIRGIKVMLDRDVAELYGVETKQLKRAVRRNINRFPEDFMFQLTKEEYQLLRSQFGTFKRGGHSKYLPMAFTEQGVAMLSSILNSNRAIEVNIAIMRVFVKLRETMATHTELTHKLSDLARFSHETERLRNKAFQPEDVVFYFEG